MNEARLEELKKILNERRQNLEQGSRENSDAQNFDTSKSVSSNLNASNFNALDLNSTNSKALNSNDQNSDELNLDVECCRKFQNSNSDDAASNKNSKTQARDYDKEPIVIKDYIYGEYGVYSIFIFIPILFIATIAVNETASGILPNFFLVAGMIGVCIYRNNKANIDKKRFELRQERIVYISKDEIKEIKISDIEKIRKSNDIRYEFDQRNGWFDKAFIITWLTLGILIEGASVIISFVAAFIFAFLSVKFLMHLHKGGIASLMLFDQIIIYEKPKNGGKMLNILVMSNHEMIEIKRYFLSKLNTDIDKVAITWSVYSEI